MTLKVNTCQVAAGNLQAVLEPSVATGIPLSKVMATLGPATHTQAIIVDLLKAGVSCCRFDLSWGPLDYHLDTLSLLQSAVAETKILCASCLDVAGKTCSVLQPYTINDSGWPVYSQVLNITSGQVVVVTADPIAKLTVPQDPSEACILPVTHTGLARSVVPGDQLDVGRYLEMNNSDQAVRLQVQRVNNAEIHCIAQGTLSVEGWMTVHCVTQDMLNLHSETNASAVNESDLTSIQAFHDRGALDFVILGDIECAADVTGVRTHLDGIGAHDTKIIAKLQSAQSLMEFGNIALLADGIMIARGALGMHVKPEKMAIIQKRVITLCNLMGKPCVVSRILDSMQTAPRPTRAEATDVANSVLDGADAFLLGAETLRGAHPVECVHTVMGICREAERVFDMRVYHNKLNEFSGEGSPQWIQTMLGSKSAIFSESGTSAADSRGYQSTNTTSHGLEDKRSNYMGSSHKGRHPQFKPVLDTLLSMRVREDDSSSTAPSPPVSSAQSSTFPSADLSGPLPPRPVNTDRDAKLDTGDCDETLQIGRKFVKKAGGIGRAASWGALCPESVSPACSTPRTSACAPGVFESQSTGSLVALVGSSKNLSMLSSSRLKGSYSDFNSLHNASVHPKLALLTAPMTNEEVAATIAVRTATKSKCRLLMVITASGRTASLVAKYKPSMPILGVVVPRVVRKGVTWNIQGAAIARQCALLRGVIPAMASVTSDGRGMVISGLEHAKATGLVTDEDDVVCIMRMNDTVSCTGYCLSVQLINVGDQLNGSEGTSSFCELA